LVYDTLKAALLFVIDFKGVSPINLRM